MSMQEATLENKDETGALAGEFVRSLTPRKEGATVVALYGDLGSGKTSFTQGAARALGVNQTVISPTFVIERVYALSHKNFDRLIHLDCYRMENDDEMKSIGWNEKIRNPKNLVFVEWAEKVEEMLPKNTVRVYFEHVNETTRHIAINSKCKNQNAKLLYSPSANEF